MKVRLPLPAFAALTMFAIASPAAAQTIQLPTFQFFTVTTTVNVPDDGQVLLGGVMRHSEGRNERGTPFLGKLPVLGRPFRNVGIGRDTSSSLTWVKVHIHDFEAMEEALLGEPVYGRGRLSSAPHRARQEFANGRRAVRVADVRPQKREPTEQERLADLLDRAQRAEAAGKPHVAKIYYRALSREVTGDLRETVLARLEALRGDRARLARQPQR